MDDGAPSAPADPVELRRRAEWSAHVEGFATSARTLAFPLNAICFKCHTELEAALDEIDALRRRAPPRPAVDRRSVSAPVGAVASLEADLDALRRDVASLRPRQQVSRPTWLLFAAAGVALAAWILTPEDLPYTAALAS